jgi:hypothetical protein
VCPYDARPFGTATGIFRGDAEYPCLVVYDESLGKDLATLLNWAAEDRARHKDLQPQ